MDWSFFCFCAITIISGKSFIFNSSWNYIRWSWIKVESKLKSDIYFSWWTCPIQVWKDKMLIPDIINLMQLKLFHEFCWYLINLFSDKTFKHPLHYPPFLLPSLHFIFQKVFFFLFIILCNIHQLHASFTIDQMCVVLHHNF